MLRPAIKSAHQPYTLPGHRIIVGLMQYGVAAEIQDDEEDSIARLLTLMDGTRDLDAIRADFDRTHPGHSAESVTEVVRDLIDQGFVEDAAAPPPATLTDAQTERYRSARQFYSWIDTTPRESPWSVQERIGAARVVLLGLGGTGSAVAAGLVASGIGGLHCVDFDRIEPGNLTRQLLYVESDVGEPKLAAGLRRLRAMNPHVTVTGEELRVGSAADVARLMADADVFVLCADQPDQLIQEWTNEAALATGTPWFMSLYTGPMVVVGSFLPGRTGCYACMIRGERQREINSVGRPLTDLPRPNAVVAANANVGGHLCALEVLYHLGGLPQQTAGRLYHHNVARWDHQYFIDVVQDPGCPACGERPAPPTGEPAG
ncbi:hypothetical protein GCE86_15285 [Micromonospora terminaliae]|uniref:ThiF family adenylyltransferase n=1 Tax=Micromonospora terminaliae TaxID=1914461 RepID=A0AAJ2ZC12_9ACTN|nr:ThiF family adenylyltransferase [Micromonospora terminaliae]NES26953.1 ThiF family adenylyltransferase [Micromonospora terminaliae]QGL48266.1 hypothetical protein GCE86_15285 [Micromonospora terminaliae]